jgi:hypothetical protein
MAVLLRDELAEPVQNGRRLHDGAARSAFIRGEQLARRGQAATLLGREGDLLAAHDGIGPFPKDAPFFFDIVESALQPIVDRAGDRRDDELQRQRQRQWPDCSRLAALSKLHIHVNSWENLGDDFLDRTGSLVARRIAVAASVLAFNDAFLLGAGIVGAGAIPALFLASKSKSPARGVAATVEIVD